MLPSTRDILQDLLSEAIQVNLFEEIPFMASKGDSQMAGKVMGLWYPRVRAGARGDKTHAQINSADVYRVYREGSVELAGVHSKTTFLQGSDPPFWKSVASGSSQEPLLRGYRPSPRLPFWD